jgi:hypothetical protein
LTEGHSNLPTLKLSTDIEYDWLLDGDCTAPDDGLTPKSRRRKQFGEPALDQPLEMMELEDPSLVTASCSPDSVLDDTLESGEGIIEFADCREFECDASGVDGNGGRDDASEKDWGGFASAEMSSKQSAVQFEEQVEEIRNKHASEEDGFIGCVVDTSNGHLQVNEHGTYQEYQPPDEIHRLVANLDAELDITIDECLNGSVDASGSQEEDYFNDNSESLGSTGALQMPDDSLQASHDNDYSDIAKGLQTSKSLHNNSNYRQSLLMSSKLMESLSMPIPDMASDHLASFTYRVQKQHRDAMGLRPDEMTDISTSLFDDELIERKLADTIHSGYFEATEAHDDNFDSIVLDEVLNVPWPFYQLDMNEPIVEDEYNELDPEEIDSTNELNFDSYIFNRLGQLDVAKGEVMKSIISRVSLKEKNIDAGIERILAAELDIATALMYTNSSRETVQRMLTGYPVDGQPTKHFEPHNVILGGLRVLDISDTRDRIQYLGDAIERISDISDQEVLFWKDIPNLKSHNSPVLQPEKYHSLVERARKLHHLSLEEEVLNHVSSLHSLRDRIQSLSSVLLECMEDTIADFIQRMLNADDVNNDKYAQEYESIVHAWVSCCQLRQYRGSDLASQNIFAEEWSGCLLKVLCFEISKAHVYSLIDILEGNPESEHIKKQLDMLKCSLTNDSDIDRLTSTLLEGQPGVSSSFSRLASRATEVLLIYSLLLQWHSCLVDILKDDCHDSCKFLNADVKSDNMSSISADEVSLVTSTTDNDDDDASDERPKAPVPQCFEIHSKTDESSDLLHECMLKCMRSRFVRHPLFTFCESKLTQSIEICSSCASTKLLLEDLRTMDDVFRQFTQFSHHFLGDEYDGESELCMNIENALTELYQAHIRSVHIEAMKTTGTLLRHESWQLSPMSFTLASLDDDEKKSEGGGSTCDEQSAVLIALHHVSLCCSTFLSKHSQ